MLMNVAAIDFHAVEPHQRDIDKRLHNWGRWCNGTTAPMTSPMFRMTPPPPRVRGDLAYQSGKPVDAMDAAKIAKAVAALPQSHRAAINWSYVKPVSPKRACQAIGTSMQGLQWLVRDGRQMLINREV
jgi:DNA-directed RNA polymerase specialized sigma24 family protein